MTVRRDRRKYACCNCRVAAAARIKGYDGLRCLVVEVKFAVRLRKVIIFSDGEVYQPVGYDVILSVRFDAVAWLRRYTK